MREALHVIDHDVFSLPFTATEDEIGNLKKLAQKDLFRCPYCHAKLIVKSGEKRGLYFSHLHSEACEESRKVDQAEKKYGRQIERETKIHQAIMNILHDELSIQAKITPGMQVDYGFKVKPDLKEYPDIWMKWESREFAISVVTNVSHFTDGKLASTIVNRHQAFLEKGMVPIWFIEKKEQSIEKEKNAIVLWDAEMSISGKTKEDREWDKLLVSLTRDPNFYDYFHYPISNANQAIDVRSMYYIYSNDEKIVVKVQRFLKDRTEKPFRAFLLNEGYEIPFAEALAIKNGSFLSNPHIEKQQREIFLKRYQQLNEAFLEKQRLEKEKQQLEIEQKQQYLQKLLEQKQLHKAETSLSYNDLKALLRERIQLKQREQMELWNHFMPKIGLKNSALVWQLVQEHNCTSFDELRNILQHTIREQR